MQKQPSRGSWLITAPLAALTLAYVLLFYLPGSKARAALQTEIDLKRQAIASGPMLAAEMERVATERREVEEFVAGWRERSKQVSPGLFGRMSGLIEDAGLATTRFEPDNAVEMDQLRQLHLTLGCQGDVGQFFALLKGIEQLPHTTWIEMLRLERKGQTEQELQGTLKLVVFVDKSEISN
jgi:hypothetical protein